MFWLKFKNKSMCIDDAAFVVVEVVVKKFDLVRPIFAAFGSNIFCACMQKSFCLLEEVKMLHKKITKLNSLLTLVAACTF